MLIFFFFWFLLVSVLIPLSDTYFLAVEAFSSTSSFSSTFVPSSFHFFPSFCKSPVTSNALLPSSCFYSSSYRRRGNWFSKRLKKKETTSSLTSLRAIEQEQEIEENERKKTDRETNTNRKHDEIDHVVILGGGFGGLYTALKLNELYTSDQLNNPQNMKTIEALEKKQEKKLKITVIDQNDRFLFLPLLYDLSVDDASQEEVAPTFVDLFKNQPFIDFQQGFVYSLDREKKCVSYKTEINGELLMKEMPYDKMLIALGSETNWDSIPGSKENAMSFTTLEDAMTLKERLEHLTSPPSLNQKGGKNFVRVVVIGGGYAGVEVSSSIMQKLGRNKCSVTLITRGQGDNAILGNTSSTLNRDVAKKRLRELDVDVIEGATVKRIETEGRVIVSSSPSSIPSSTKTETSTEKLEEQEQIIHGDIIINTSGAKSNPIINDFPLTFNQKYGNRICVTDLLQTLNDDNIFAIGDNAIIEGMEELPTTAQVAFQQAEYAAWNLYYSLLTQKRQRPLSSGKKIKQKKSISSISTPASSVMIKPLAFRYLNLGEMLSLGTNHAAVSTLNDKVEIKGLVGSLARRLVYAIRMPTMKQQTTSIRSVVKSTIRSLRG